VSLLTYLARRAAELARVRQSFDNLDAPPHAARDDATDAAVAAALRRRAAADLAVINRIAAAANLPQVRLWDDDER
jgi:hypothetical protein